MRRSTVLILPIRLVFTNLTVAKDNTVKHTCLCVYVLIKTRKIKSEIKNAISTFTNFNYFL
jgi:hypothetical protein